METLTNIEDAIKILKKAKNIKMTLTAYSDVDITPLPVGISRSEMHDVLTPKMIKYVAMVEIQATEDENDYYKVEVSLLPNFYNNSNFTVQRIDTKAGILTQPDESKRLTLRMAYALFNVFRNVVEKDEDAIKQFDGLVQVDSVSKVYTVPAPEPAVGILKSSGTVIDTIDTCATAVGSSMIDYTTIDYSKVAKYVKEYLDKHHDDATSKYFDDYLDSRYD